MARSRLSEDRGPCFFWGKVSNWGFLGEDSTSSRDGDFDFCSRGGDSNLCVSDESSNSLLTLVWTQNIAFLYLTERVTYDGFAGLLPLQFGLGPYLTYTLRWSFLLVMKTKILCTCSENLSFMFHGEDSNLGKSFVGEVS